MSLLFRRGPPSSISKASVVSMLFERLVSVYLGRFMEPSGVLPKTEFADQKGLGTCNAHLCMSHIVQGALEGGQDARIVQIDFSTALERVKNQGIFNKLCCVGIGGSVLSILKQFLSNRSKYAMFLSSRTKLVNVVSGVHLMNTSELFSILENKLIGYADDSTLIAVVPSQGIRVTVAESLSHDLVKVSERCDLSGMKLNASMTKTMITSRSGTMHPMSPALTIGGTVLKKSDYHVMMGVTFDSKKSFEKYLSWISRAASQRHGILIMSWHVFHGKLLLGRSFLGFVLPVLESCSAV